MADQYLWKKGDRTLGPACLADLQIMIRRGDLGRFEKVSADNGKSWAAAQDFAELWVDLVPVAAPPETSLPDPAPINIPATLTTSHGGGPLAVSHESRPPTTSRGWGLGLAGFIITTSALVLTLAPLLVWMLAYPAGYWAVPFVFPLLVASITGLVLSSTAMGRAPSGFATTGLVVGICGSLIGIVTAIGWLVSNDPRDRWIVNLTATAEADVALARQNFDSSLRRYRDHAINDDHADALERVTKDLIILSRANKRLLQAAASTPRFRKHFMKLGDLQSAYSSFREVVKLRDQINPQEAIDRIGENQTDLKELLDLWELHQTGQLMIESLQAKFRDF
jgi:uncharacterized integral membrane protein